MADLAPITVQGTPEVAPPPAAPPGNGEIRAIPTEQGHVALVDDAGEVQSVPRENVERAVREFGYRPASDVEYYTAKTGTPGAIMAGVQGFGRGLSLGTSDALAVGASRLLEGEKGAQEMRDTLRLLKEGHSTASMVGEIGGSLAPLAFGIGAPGAAAEAAEGASLLSRVAGGAVRSMPRAFLEGAAIGMGNQLSEDTLGNHDLSAQKYITSGLEGGLLGSLLGAGMHAGAGVLSEKLAARAASKATALEKAGETGSSRVGSALADFAETQAAKAAMPNSGLSVPVMSKLGRTVEDQGTRLRRMGRALIDEGVVTAGADRATMATRITPALEKSGKRIDALEMKLEQAAVRPSAENVLNRIKDEVVSPLLNRSFSEAEQAAIKPYIGEILNKAGGKTNFESFEQLGKLRKDLDAKLYPKMIKGRQPAAPLVGSEELEKIRGILKDEYANAAELASKELGENVHQSYKVEQALYSDLAEAKKWLTKGAGQAAQNRAISLTDTIAGAGGIASAVASGNPLPLLAPIANKVMRTYGNQAAAMIADKAAGIMGVQRAAAAFDDKLARAVKGFYKGGEKGAKVPSARTPDVDPETVRILRRGAKDPDALVAHVANQMQQSGLSQVAPKIAQSVTGTIVRAASYLQQNLPAEPPPAGVQFKEPKARALGPMAQTKINAVVGALDTQGMLAEIERGRVDRQKVEALKFINPELHNQIVNALVQHGMENGATLSHQQEVAMSILTGKPIGAMMQPRTIQGFQKAFASQGPAPEPGAGGGQTKQFGGAQSSGPSRVAQTMMSPTEKMEAENAL